MSTKRIGILILSHGDFCESALRTAALLGADAEGVSALSLRENVSMESYESEVRAALSALPAGSLVFLDLFGGTPFNQVMRLLSTYPIHAVTGFNLPMLIEAMSSREEYAGPELVEAVLSAGAAGIRDANRFLAELHQD